jgi:hypothetical protein
MTIFLPDLGKKKIDAIKTLGNEPILQYNIKKCCNIRRDFFWKLSRLKEDRNEKDIDCS